MNNMEAAVELAMEWNTASQAIKKRTRPLYEEEMGKIFFVEAIKRPYTPTIITGGMVWRLVRDNDGATSKFLSDTLGTARTNIYHHLSKLRKCGRIESVRGKNGSAFQYYAVEA